VIQEMIGRIGSPAAADFTADRRPQAKTTKPKPQEQEDAGEAPPPPAPKPADGLRLVIERSDSGYVYKLIDRDTGMVVNAIPRSAIGKLAESPDYASGNLISTTA
jgi:hypothetical protein